MACEHCEGRGWYYKANGPDDIDKEICDCQQQEEEMDSFYARKKWQDIYILLLDNTILIPDSDFTLAELANEMLHIGEEPEDLQKEYDYFKELEGGDSNGQLHT